MAKMTPEAIAEHKKNPNVRMRMQGRKFNCDCGHKYFHHVDDDEIFICNSCGCTYDVSDTIYPDHQNHGT